MRRDYGVVREILLAIALNGARTSDEIEEQLELEFDVVDYHLGLMVHGVDLLHGSRDRPMNTPGSTARAPSWEGLALTWNGNDFLDAIADEKSWRKVQKALSSGARLATIEALKQVAKGVATAGLATVLAEVEDATPSGQVDPRSLPAGAVDPVDRPTV